ncbi:MAG: dipeptide ABC transporter ATP-binding protein [Anaerolineae bacterium]
MSVMELPVLDVRDLTIVYETRKADVRAVTDVSLRIASGETYSIVGESGSGKSTLAFGVIRHLSTNARVDSGEILFQGEDLLKKNEQELRTLWGNKLAMVYQDPMSALNPVLRIGEQMAEVLVYHQGLNWQTAREHCLRALEQVQMSDPHSIMERYPHQLSGGQQQRVVIATALLTHPSLLIMDEPTTGLDVTVEARVLDLVADLKKQFEMAILYITHNLAVVARICDRVGVMYAGQLMEEASVRDLFKAPFHPYTRALLGCVPSLDTNKNTCQLQPISGQVPPLTDLPAGCVYAPRCELAMERCRQERPDVEWVTDGRRVRCFRWQEMARMEMMPLSRAEKSVAPVIHPIAAKPLLQMQGVKSYYPQQESSLAALWRVIARSERRAVKAVDGVTCEVWPGLILGVVGESGSGKSTLAKCIAGLVPLTSGQITLQGQHLNKPVEKRQRHLLKHLQMVFQNPDSTLNPAHNVGRAISRPLRLFAGVPRNQIPDRVRELLRAVKLDESYIYKMPDQLSGGEKQRVAIARAFAGQPSLVLCDEPVSSLDVSIQAAIVNLLIEFQQSYGTTLLFISHDLGVIHYLCDYIAVMYLGRLCQIGPTAEVFRPPYHPYTEALLSAIPSLDSESRRRRIVLEGNVPSALNPPQGCRFHTRCPRKVGTICETEEPPELQVGPEHRIYCHIPLDELRRIEPV